MKRSNTSFIISLIIHILAALVLVQVHREGTARRGFRGIPVEFDVKPPEPRLEAKKPKIEPIRDLNPNRRSVTRLESPRPIKITQKMDRTTAYRDVMVTQESGVPYDIGMSEEGVQMSDLLPNRSGARGARRAVKGGKSQLVEFVDKSRGKRRIIYCMDVSASMGASNKLNLARNYLKDSLLALNSKKDEFNIIAFAKSVRVFRPDTLIPVTKENLADALDFLDEYTIQNIKMNTKTDLLAPLMRALEMKPSIIALVTDGLPTAGVTHPEKIIQSVREKNIGGSVRIFAIGMEMDTDQPEAWLLRAIAEQNDGEFQFF
jgi:Mg-chelatase subunit ChlD